MSKYTTQVRDVCNEILLVNEAIAMPKENMSVDEILRQTWDKIFDPFVFWNTEGREQLCVDILKHYYTREIGFETVALWKLKVNTRIHEIIPYYNRLFESEVVKYDPFIDTNYTRTVDGKESGENNNAENTNRKNEVITAETYDNDTTDSGSNHGVSKFSDTPQGGLVGVENGTYLTNVTINDNEGSSERNEAGKRNGTSKGEETVGLIGTGAFANKSNLVESIIGKRSGISYSKAMMEYRDSLMNVELKLINEFKDLFMLLW